MLNKNLQPGAPCSQRWEHIWWLMAVW